VSVRRLGELGLIRRIRDEAERSPAAGVTVGIGDDTAVLALSPGAALLATTDLVVEDVHFRRTWAAPEDIGWKAMAVNLSDIAAMGGTPRWALVALAVPADTEVAEIEAFYRGMRAAAAPHAVAIVGGDTSVSPERWVIDVTLLGEHAGAPRLRSGARPGDAIAVTGSLGRAAAGLVVLEMGADQARRHGLGDTVVEEVTRAHLRPRARVPEGRWLGETRDVHAMMDCSDGLLTDLGHVCRESGVGARVSLERLPLAPGAEAAARARGRDPLEWATGGGEDYELLLTCDPAAVDRLSREFRRSTGTPLTVIGEVEAGPAAIRWLGRNGQPVTMGAGYEHFRG
jgi:thiamine-monophosphate kinase